MCKYYTVFALFAAHPSSMADPCQVSRSPPHPGSTTAGFPTQVSWTSSSDLSAVPLPSLTNATQIPGGDCSYCCELQTLKLLTLTPTQTTTTNPNCIYSVGDF